MAGSSTYNLIVDIGPVVSDYVSTCLPRAVLAVYHKDLVSAAIITYRLIPTINKTRTFVQETPVF